MGKVPLEVWNPGNCSVREFLWSVEKQFPALAETSSREGGRRAAYTAVCQ